MYDYNNKSNGKEVQEAVPTGKVRIAFCLRYPDLILGNSFLLYPPAMPSPCSPRVQKLTLALGLSHQLLPLPGTHSSRSLLYKLTFAGKPLLDASLQHSLRGAQNSLTAPPFVCGLFILCFLPSFVTSKVQSPPQPQLAGELLQTVGTW